MRLAALALLSAWLAMPATAQTVDALSRTEINTFSASNANRTLTACLVPDLQNQTSQSDLTGANPSVDCSHTTYCTGASCTSSPYCSGTWWNTGEIILRNQAYSLTGQWAKIDYTAIDGPDTVRSKKPHPLDHGPCDVIVGLGDNLDSADTKTYAELTAPMLHQYAMALMFWRIVKDSGIPFIIARGNHEGEGTFSQLLTDLGVASLSFHHAVHSDGDQYAIKFATRLGKDLCILTLDSDDNDQPATADGDQYTASEAAWVLSTTGCGSDLPTMLVGHEQVNQDGPATLDPEAATVVGTASADEIFIVAGGHYQDPPPVSRKIQGTNLGGKAVFKLFSNWQEYNRHNTNVGGNGTTPSDGIGGAYTVVHIDANADSLCAYDWNPYFQTRSTKGAPQDTGAVDFFSSACFTFDFDARYP